MMRDARTAYLETQIKTAAPQKLRLMLIEAAIRFARQAQEAGGGEAFSLGLERARDVVTELIAGIRPEKHPLNDAARTLYAFIFRALSEAQLLYDLSKIDDALQVLDEERQTWLQVCEQLPDAPPAETSDFRHQEIVDSGLQPVAGTNSFSLDA